MQKFRFKNSTLNMYMAAVHLFLHSTFYAAAPTSRSIDPHHQTSALEHSSDVQLEQPLHSLHRLFAACTACAQPGHSLCRLCPASTGCAQPGQALPSLNRLGTLFAALQRSALQQPYTSPTTASQHQLIRSLVAACRAEPCAGPHQKVDVVLPSL